MAKIPEPQNQTAAAIYKMHADRVNKEESRPYLGISEWGEECPRRLWLSWRWVKRQKFDGRIARLFDTGHREEERVLQELRDIGCTVYDRDEHGHQYACSAVSGHVRGHIDAVIVGLPEAPKTPHLFDAKTINRKKMDELQKHGIRKTFPKYWAQGQGYMGYFDLKRSVFLFICKDDDTIHLERFEFDSAEFKRLEDRAKKIIEASRPPERINADPAWHVCRMCPMHALCHGTAAPEVNCRTCAHATPVTEAADARWLCEHPTRAVAPLTVPKQREGCAAHRVIPILLERFAEPIDATDDTVTYRNKATGAEFVNGERPGCVTSAEIHALADKRVLGQERDPASFHAELAREFGEVEYVG